jgi:anti-anti-sigma factor
MLAVRGEIDLTVAADLLQTITCAGSTGDIPEVVVDLDRVTFLDSTGIAALMRAYQLLAERGTALRVQGGPDNVRSVLAITGVDGVLGLAPSFEEEPAAVNA